MVFIVYWIGGCTGDLFYNDKSKTFLPTPRNTCSRELGGAGVLVLQSENHFFRHQLRLTKKLR